jgi:hypothetical protein
VGRHAEIHPVDREHRIASEDCIAELRVLAHERRARDGFRAQPLADVMQQVPSRPSRLHFLEGDEPWVDLGQHRGHALGVEHAVAADRAVDVVGCEHRGRRHGRPQFVGGHSLNGNGLESP